MAKLSPSVRSHNLFQHGDGDAGAVAAAVHDGPHGRAQVAAGRGLSAGLDLVPDRDHRCAKIIHDLRPIHVEAIFDFFITAKDPRSRSRITF